MVNVLVVDDDPAIVVLLSELFCAVTGSCSVVTAGNGLEALKVLESSRVDVVLTDLNMPVMDGFALISRIRTAYPDMPVIVMTGSQEKDTAQRLSDLGIHHYRVKPFSMRGLVTEVTAGPEFSKARCGLPAADNAAHA